MNGSAKSSNKHRSRFKRAIGELVDRTGMPLFRRMQETGRAIPMALGTGKALMDALPNGEKRRVRRALHLLTRSKRYLQALAADDARRFDVYGEPAETVTIGMRDRARLELVGRTAPAKSQDKPEARPEART